MKRITITLLALSLGVSAAEFEGFTLDEARQYRNSWTIDNWDDGGPLMHYVFLNMSEFWNHSVVHRGEMVKELPVQPRNDVADFAATTERGNISLLDYVNDSTVDGAIVLHQGDIVFETYPRMRPNDKHLHMSVSKPVASTIIAILEDGELIDSSKPVETYLPQLAGSGWEGVPVIDVLDMASGIDCRQQVPGAYENPELCYYQFEASLGWLRPDESTWDSTHEYIASFQPRIDSGQVFEYSSTNTFVLAWIAEAVTGKTYAELVATEIWSRAGAEFDALLTAPNRGVQLASNGMNSTLRDLARFGLLFTPSGRTAIDPLISDTYLDKIQNGGRPEIFNAGREDNPRQVDDEPARHNSYQWDFVMDDGDFYKGGYGGQGLYISPSKDLVIAFFGTFDADGNGHEMTRIARQLAKSGLFDQ